MFLWAAVKSVHRKPLHIRTTAQEDNSTNGRHYRCSGYLAGIHRNGCEGSLRQGDRGPQEVPCVSPFLLVLSTVLHFQLFFRQNGFITRSIPRWWEEFKFSMSPPKQKAYPTKDACQGQVELWCMESSLTNKTHGINN